MRRLSDERGATAVLVAILVVVLFGFAAFAVDVGALYQERRELQNGADAAALAVVQECAESGIGSSGCAPTLTTSVVTDCGIGVPLDPTLADTYADGNANDQAAAVEYATLNPIDQTVTVKTSTELTDGANALPHWFAPVLGIDETTVSACATAAWGFPILLVTIPLAISTCEYDQSTTNGTAFAEPTFYDDTEVTLIFHDGNPGDTNGCPVAPANQDTDGNGLLPAGFGWLETDGDCNVMTTTVDGEDWATKRPSNSPSNGCDAATVYSKLKPGTVVAIPVFDDFCRPSQDPSCPTFNNKDKYHIARYAAFYVSGYRLGGSSAWRKWDGVYRTSAPCPPPPADQRCISGYFTPTVVLEGELGGPPGGVLVVRLVS